jgi:hypothetical protein
MIIVLLICIASAFFGFGVFTGAQLALAEVKKRSIQNIDYKERWLLATSLLEGEGRITQNELRQLGLGGSIVPAIESTPEEQERKTRQKHLNQLTSYHRRMLEVDRAKNGQPPMDNLNGLSAVDLHYVLQARDEQERKMAKQREKQSSTELDNI